MTDGGNTSEPSFWQKLSRRQKAAGAAIAAAFLAAIGTALGTWLIEGAETATRQLLEIRNPPDAPLSVRVAEPGTYMPAHVFAPYYIVPKEKVESPDALPAAETGDDSTYFDQGWAKRHGAIPGSPQVVRLEIRAKGDEPVTVNQIRVRVVERQEALEGWYVAAPGCGVQPVRTAAVDLDAPVPEVQFFDESGPSTQLTLSVTRTVLEVVELHAATKTSMVDWVAEVFYSGPDGNGALTVSDDGLPFRVSTERASEGYTFGSVSEDGRWLIERVPRWDAEGITAC